MTASADLIGQADIAMRCAPIGRAIHRFLLEEMHHASRPDYNPIGRSLLLNVRLLAIEAETA
jgi:hypothetical protein